MEELKKLNINWPKTIKIFGLVVLALVVLSIAINLIFKPIMSQVRMPLMTKNSNFGLSAQQVYSPSAAVDYYDYKKADGVSLSYSNVAGSINNGAYSSDELSSPGGNFEVTDYNATVETGNLEKDCSQIASLKGREYIIFNNSNVGKKSCNFSFKVEREKSDEVLGMIKGLKPRDMSQNVETIKKQIEDFTSREEILKSKQASIDDTLKTAITAYDEITKLATKTNDAKSLAEVIDSKINILERLTSERLQVSNELESLVKAKAEQLDRLKYINFYVYIYENKIVDSQNLKDSWVTSFKQFIFDTNQILKDLSVGLVVLVLSIIKYLIYILLIFFVVKFCWKAGKNLWRK